MKTSRCLICVGVGVLTVCGQMEAILAQTAPVSQLQQALLFNRLSAKSAAVVSADRIFAIEPSWAEAADDQTAQSKLLLTTGVGSEMELALQPEVVKLSLPGLMGQPRKFSPLAQRSTQPPPAIAFNPGVKLPATAPTIAQQPPKGGQPTPGDAPKSSSPLPPTTPQPPTGGQPVPTPVVAPTPLSTPQIPNFDPKAPAPSYLNPSPNPLNFPTKPEEVKLLGIQPISLQQAQELAAKNNRTLEVAKLQLERSREALRQQQAALFPTVDAQLDLDRSQSASNGISRNSDLDPVTTSLNGSIRLNYDVFTSGQRPATIRAAEKRVRVSELEVEKQTEDLRLAVSTTYYNLQNADQQVQINEAAVRNATQSLRDTVAQERAGLGTQFDVLRAQVQLANAKQQLVNSIAAQKIQRRQLAQQLSLAEGIDLYAGDPVAPAGTWKIPLEDSVVLAYKNRADLEEQLVNREIAEQERKAALAELGPTVSVSAQYNLLDVFEQPVTVSDGYSLSAQARWRLLDGGRARAIARQQEKVKEIAERNFAGQREQVRFNVEQAYANLQANLGNIETATAAEKDAERSLFLARLRFQAGVGTQSDVINAETDLTRAQGNRVGAIIGYNRSLAELQRAVSNVSSPTLSK